MNIKKLALYAAVAVAALIVFHTVYGAYVASRAAGSVS